MFVIVISNNDVVTWVEVDKNFLSAFRDNGFIFGVGRIFGTRRLLEAVEGSEGLELMLMSARMPMHHLESSRAQILELESVFGS